jgi:glycosyltransferase involved in cell wall biosynthesis/ribosomal protein S18 acetylase RimI-like enzyme
VTALRVAHIATVDLTHRFLLFDQLRALTEAGLDVSAISAPGPWSHELRDAGIRHIPWRSITRSWNPRADIQAFRELLLIIQQERFHLVHTHTPKAGVLGRVAARASRVPCVMNTVHGLYATPDDSLKKKVPVLAAEWLAARGSDLELYQSEEDLSWARRLRLVSRSKSELLGNGTDLKRFRPDIISASERDGLMAELGLAPDALVVGAVGRLVEEKGFNELFEAATQVRRVVPEARFLIVGAADSHKEHALSAERLAAARRDCVFVGWRKDVERFMGLMDVFVLPSWREGVPRSAIEAAAMGLPMILSDIRGCREVADHGRAATLVPPRNATALAEALISLLRDPARRRDLGRRARRHALDRFDENRIIHTVVDRTKEQLAHKGFQMDADAVLNLRRARHDDVRALARLHRSRISTGFLSSLGDSFLNQIYASLVRDPRAVVTVAEEGGQVIGFAAGVPSIRSFYRRFALRRGLQALLIVAPLLIRRGVARGLLETATYPNGGPALPDAELLAIATANGSQSRGIGRALVSDVIAGLRAQGIGDIKVVVGAENADANAFYARIGLRHHATLSVHRGTPSNVWVAQWP